MRPLSRTMIWSACSTVLRRCAMTTTVRCRPRPSDHRARWRASETRRLAAGSSADVGSSRMRMGGSRMRARAMAMRWRWPPEISFRSATTVP
mmetsp:Transcript_101796/g.328511  ORF Transcript_101796/g.328511 Transcript_101796/m.328511 type:complete len:92 (-) Transcript_101796:794-1069(-)